VNLISQFDPHFGLIEAGINGSELQAFSWSALTSSWAVRPLSPNQRRRESAQDRPIDFVSSHSLHATLVFVVVRPRHISPIGAAVCCFSKRRPIFRRVTGETESRSLAGSWQEKQALSMASSEGISSLKSPNSQPRVAWYYFVVLDKDLHIHGGSGNERLSRGWRTCDVSRGCPFELNRRSCL